MGWRNRSTRIARSGRASRSRILHCVYQLLREAYGTGAAAAGPDVRGGGVLCDEPLRPHRMTGGYGPHPKTRQAQRESRRAQGRAVVGAAFRQGDERARRRFEEVVDRERARGAGYAVPARERAEPGEGALGVGAPAALARDRGEVQQEAGYLRVWLERPVAVAQRADVVGAAAPVPERAIVGPEVVFEVTGEAACL